MPDEGAKSKGVSLGRYYNATQFRVDTWNKLKNIVLRLVEGRERPDDYAQARALLDELAPFETYWAFPGNHDFRQLYHLLDARDIRTLSRAVSRIVGAMMSSSYRRKHVNLGLHGEEDYLDDEDVETPEERVRRRPYFEVLFVDDLSYPQQNQQRDGLTAMRREEDAFTYEPVFVPSFEDAIIAVLFNHNIQSVVIRFGFRFKSHNDLPVLARYLKMAHIDNVDDMEPQDYGIVLADVIGRVRPELDLYLVTDQNVEDVAGRVGDSCRRIFYNQEDFLELT